MEEVHHTHKEHVWGWVGVLADWRRSRARRLIRKHRKAGPRAV